jgi:hypothetical protein
MAGLPAGFYIGALKTAGNNVMTEKIIISD